MAKRVTPSHRQRIGWWGEREAEKYLLSHGLELVARNVRTPHGEIDLVMRGPDGLVFVEVKARTTETYGLPEDALTANKKAHILASAGDYLQKLDAPEINWRVDVVAVRGKPGSTDVEITWFENALA